MARSSSRPGSLGIGIVRKPAASRIVDHPFVARLNHSIALDDDDLAALARLLERTVVIKKAKDIIVEGYEYGVLHVVQQGFAVRYKLLHSGKRQIVNVVMPGDIIGFPACFYEHAVFSVTALSDMSLSHVPLDAFADTCLERATVATALVWFAAREAAIYAEHIIDAGRREPIERLAHFLLETLTRLQAIGNASEESFVMPLSQEAIGDALGLSAPHVNRMLAELKRDGMIAMTGREVRILDRAALQILGEFHSTYLARSPVHRPKR
ncbi:Crp/Fnr family transcriptional regulator [Reyranella sp.]|uniref:Crp/Fnr family transcriptional regulator n=1 Tax=Reyranella sp. TaxID=1929291 RepID=UPI003D0CC1DE